MVVVFAWVWWVVKNFAYNVIFTEKMRRNFECICDVTVRVGSKPNWLGLIQIGTSIQLNSNRSFNSV